MVSRSGVDTGNAVYKGWCRLAGTTGARAALSKPTAGWKLTGLRDLPVDGL
jgi:hypothetical protein